MKKTVIILIAMFSIGFTKSNPIEPPPIISEIYWDNNNNWVIKFYAIGLGMRVFNDTLYFDSLRVITSKDTANFKKGIKVKIGDIILINKDSMQKPLQINKTGDFITTQCHIGGYWYNFTYTFYFGNIANSEVESPKPGQALAVLRYIDSTQQNPSPAYCLVLKNHPTIVNDSLHISLKDNYGVVKGHILGLNHKPVQGVNGSLLPLIFLHPEFNINQLDGSFIDTLYGHNYRLYISDIWNSDLIDTVIKVILDTTVDYEFIVNAFDGIQNNQVKGDVSMKSFPNPSTNEINIEVELPTGKHYTNALIKIYDSNGEIVRIMPVNTSASQNNYTVKWNGLCSDNSVASGIYYSTLELNGLKAATNKIIIAK